MIIVVRVSEDELEEMGVSESELACCILEDMDYGDFEYSGFNVEVQVEE